MRFTIEEIAEVTGGRVVVAPEGDSRQATSLTWDSRVVAPGALYVALPGERVDGHDFAAAAAQAGAAAVLASKPLSAADGELIRKAGASVVEVADSAAAVTELARAWRGRVAGRVVGITGSTGKTTTKNLVRDVLAAAGSVAATKGNQNNELGVPATVLSADADTDSVVVEMGMRGLHQIDSLCEFVRPQWGLITNVGDCHIELLGSRENIARAKAELVEALPAGGIAFLNAACDLTPLVRKIARLDERGVSCVLFDGSPDADQRCGACSDDDAVAARVWARDIALDDEGRPTFTLCYAGFAEQGVGTVACSLDLRGIHNVSNACSAAAVGLAAGMDPQVIAGALAGARAESGRQEVLRTQGGVTVINDAYNANPDSMRASLSTFAALAVPGRRIAVLGDMGELGSFAEELHVQVGRDAAAAGLDELICVGELSRAMAAAACAAGMDDARVTCVPDGARALQMLKSSLSTGDAVLVKASHFMELDGVVKGLID